jgi:hypothetical protein
MEGCGHQDAQAYWGKVVLVSGEWWDIKRWTGCSETIGDNNIASTR